MLSQEEEEDSRDRQPSGSQHSQSIETTILMMAQRGTAKLDSVKVTVPGAKEDQQRDVAISHFQGLEILNI
jgi:hypothetical protein